MVSHKKPNVVIILSDDQGWGDVGFNGNQIIHTPTLDSLAASAVVFNRFYVSPASISSRASILSGKYNLSTGASCQTIQDETFQKADITIAEVLSKNGYATAYFGKWHNGLNYSRTPLNHGFDAFFGFSEGQLNNYFDAELLYNGAKVKTQGYITDVLTDSVLNFISNSHNPFFAFVAYNTPHAPYQVPNAYLNAFKKSGITSETAAVYGMCQNIDDNVLRIQNALKTFGKHDNTIFIYMSDNGPSYVRYNGGFKGRKEQVDEGGVRVPFIIDYPKCDFIQRRINTDFAAHIDLFPTLLDLCSITADNIQFDGVSFAGNLIDSTKHFIDRKLYSYQRYNNGIVAGAVRTDKYLLTCYPDDTALCNIIEDPYQMVNIRGYEPLVYNTLIEDFHMWVEQQTYDSKEILVTK
jgi:arylsulfatase A